MTGGAVSYLDWQQVVFMQYHLLREQQSPLRAAQVQRLGANTTTGSKVNDMDTKRVSRTVREGVDPYEDTLLVLTGSDWF